MLTMTDGEVMQAAEVELHDEIPWKPILIESSMSGSVMYDIGPITKQLNT